MKKPASSANRISSPLSIDASSVYFARMEDIPIGSFAAALILGGSGGQETFESNNSTYL